MPVAELALLAWPLLVAAVSVTLRLRTALLVAVIGGVMFLPVYGFSVPGFIDYTKSTAISFAAVLVMLLKSGEGGLHWPGLRRTWPAIAFGLWPAIAFLLLGLTLKESFSAAIYMSLQISVPYLVGQIAFSSREGRRELSEGIVIGALLYVPLCLYEIRMSPQLHTMLYGFFPHSFIQTHRGGGWRPQVFMSHGLMVGLWMATGTIVALAGTWSQRFKRVATLPPAIAVGLLLITTILCKSTGATGLMLLAIASLWISWVWKSRLHLLALTLAPGLYLLARIFLGLDVSIAHELASFWSEARAQSLAYRFRFEDLLLAASRDSLLTGRGPYEFNRYVDEVGLVQTAVTDSLWVIYLARTGIVTVALYWSLLTVPLWRFFRSTPVAALMTRRTCLETSLALCVLIFAIDCLINANINPSYLVAAGALSGLSPLPAAGRTS